MSKHLQSSALSNRDKFRERSRNRRRQFGEAINAQRRRRAADKRDIAAIERWARYVENRPDKTLPWDVQLKLWFAAQLKFQNKRQLARAIGVSSRSVFDWLRGKHPPVGQEAPATVRNQRARMLQGARSSGPDDDGGESRASVSRACRTLRPGDPRTAAIDRNGTVLGDFSSSV